MATRRRDAFPGKEKATPSPQTGAAKLRGAVNLISPKPKVSTAPQRQTRPAASRAPITGVRTRKPASPATVSKPAQTRTRSLDNKTATPTQKTRVLTAAATPATGAARRVSSLPVKAVAAPKPAPAKTWKPVEKEEEGKRRLSTTSVSSGRRSSIGLKKESGRSAPATATKEQHITGFNLDKNEDLSMYNVPEPEMQLQDIEYSYLNEAEEKTVQSLSDFEKGIDDLVREEKVPLDFAEIEDVINADPTVVIAGSSTVSGQQESPADIKTQALESSSKQELEHDMMYETNNCNKVEKIADNPHEEAKEKEVKVVEVAAEEQAAVVSKVVESKEIEPAVEKKLNSVPQRQQEKIHGKYDSPVSNDVIEETANKLREMRRNKVRALAGAFETVISLQEK